MTDEPSALATQPEAPVRPLGAPTDLTHPTGRDQGSVAATGLTDDQLRGVGRFLAFGWAGTVVLRFLLLTGSSSPAWERATWLVPALYLVAVHVYAVRTGQKAILRGFWPPVLIGVAVLLVAPVVVFFLALAGVV